MLMDSSEWGGCCTVSGGLHAITIYKSTKANSIECTLFKGHSIQLKKPQVNKEDVKHQKYFS